MQNESQTCHKLHHSSKVLISMALPLNPFSKEHLLQLAPNSKVLSQARKLFFARRWKVLEGNGKWIWGEYETPYGDVMRAVVQFEPPVLKCSCWHSIL